VSSPDNYDAKAASSSYYEEKTEVIIYGEENVTN
jgi:hypothetical protein